MESVKVITIGVSGFPYSNTAAVHKCIYVCKALLEAGLEPLVINNKAAYKQSNQIVNTNGFYEGIEYRSTVKNPYQSSSKIRKNLFKLLGKLNEVLFLIKYRFQTKKKITVFFYTQNSFLELICFRVLFLILQYKLVIIYHEFRSDFESRKGSVFLKWNDRLFDSNFPYFVDAILPISEFLISHIKTISKNKLILKLPPLIDFDLYNWQEKKAKDDFFLFCGSAGHNDIILFIIQSFEKMDVISETYLYLIVSGSAIEMENLKQIIHKSNKSNKIKVFSDISSNHLISLYNSAKGLLIPLRENIRDKARFPQKIAEYVASGNPIISTNYGEIKYYFKDGVNAFVSEKYEINAFAEKMKFVLQNPEIAKNVGYAGMLMGKEVFDYRNYSSKLRVLIEEVN